MTLACAFPSLLNVPPPTPTARATAAQTAPAETAVPPSSAAESVPTPLPAPIRPPGTAAQPVAIPTPAPVQPILGDGLAYTVPASPNQTAVFPLAWRSGGRYLLLAQPTAGLDPVLTLQTAAGTQTYDETGSAAPELWLLSAPDEEATLTLSAFGQTAGESTVTIIDLDGSTVTRPLDVSTAVAESDLIRHPVTLTADTLVIATLRPTAEFDGVVELYAPAGFVTSRDENGDGQTEQIVFTPDVTAEYVFTVFGFQGQAGEYRLELIAVPLPFD